MTPVTTWAEQLADALEIQRNRRASLLLAIRRGEGGLRGELEDCGRRIVQLAVQWAEVERG